MAGAPDIRPLVVVVSGRSGAGKSSLVAALAEAAERSGRAAATLHFDDFARDLRLSSRDVTAWLARGADPRELRTVELERALEVLVDPRHEDRDRVDVVLVEEPFGRARPPFDAVADVALHLRLPPAAALARRVLRDFVPEGSGLDPTGVARLRRHLTGYLGWGQDLYDAVDAAALPAADVVLDASLAREVTAGLAWETVLARLPSRPASG